MNRSQRRTLIDAYALLRIRAEEGERLARQLSVQDIGVTTIDRHVDTAKILSHTMTFATDAALLLKSIEQAIGASVILERAKYPRAKPIASSKKS